VRLCKDCAHFDLVDDYSACFCPEIVGAQKKDVVTGEPTPRHWVSCYVARDDAKPGPCGGDARYFRIRSFPHVAMENHLAAIAKIRRDVRCRSDSQS
jgi:hypothetical protein